MDNPANDPRPELTIVGLGPGDPGQLSRAAWDAIQAARLILLRTRIHPTVAFLEAEGVVFESCDDLYEHCSSFEETYTCIAQRVLDLVRTGESVVFAVPGHPLFGERAVDLIRQDARASQIQVRIIPSAGFLDVVLPAVGLDIGAGVAVLDGASPVPPPLGIPTVYYQVYDSWIASDLKLSLLEVLPPETVVWHVQSAGTPDERARTVPLFALDRLPCDHLTSIVVPAMTQAAGGAFETGGALELDGTVRWEDAETGDWANGADDEDSSDDTESHGEDAGEKFLTLVSLMTRLRAPGGCPWDREQTFETLRRYVLEEAHEVVDCIDRGDFAHLPDELGDLLLQVVFQSEIAREAGLFQVEDVLDQISGKLIRRHPHVFGDVSVASSNEVLVNWEIIKKKERAGEAANQQASTPESAIAGVPLAMPAVLRADKVFRKASRVGFDWPNVEGTLKKVEEELAEVREAAASGDVHRTAEEVGDLFLAVINLARKLEIDPENATREALTRFVQRFHAMEQEAHRRGQSLTDLDASALDGLWEWAKASLT